MLKIEKEFKSFKITKEVIETKRYNYSTVMKGLDEESIKKYIEEEQKLPEPTYNNCGEMESDLLSRKVNITIEEVK